MISRGSKQGAGRANLRKKPKQMNYKGLKQGAGWANMRKKRENECINRGLNSKRGRPT